MPTNFTFDGRVPEGLDPELLDRHLAGEGSEAENAAMRRYLMTRPDVAGALREFLVRVDGESGRPPAPDAMHSLAAVRSRMRHRPAAPAGLASPPAPPRAPRPRMFPMLSRQRAGRGERAVRMVMAASIVVLVAVAASQRTAPLPPPAPAPAPPRTYATNNAEHAELRLIDGTEVRLAPASRLRVAGDFGEGRREVFLEGEAYFDVVHDATQPFLVHAGNTVAEDLGTAFAVRSYPEDEAVQVVVKEGIVALGGVGTLGEGDLGRLTRQGEAALHRNVDVDSLLGWLDGRLTFVDAPLDEVLRAIVRWHDVEVVLADSALGAIPFTGTLTNASSAASLDLVAATTGLRLERSGTQVTLSAVPGRTPVRR